MTVTVTRGKVVGGGHGEAKGKEREKRLYPQNYHANKINLTLLPHLCPSTDCHRNPAEHTAKLLHKFFTVNFSLGERIQEIIEYPLKICK